MLPERLFMSSCRLFFRYDAASMG